MAILLALSSGNTGILSGLGTIIGLSAPLIALWIINKRQADKEWLQHVEAELLQTKATLQECQDERKRLSDENLVLMRKLLFNGERRERDR